MDQIGKKIVKRSVNWEQEEKDLLSSIVMEKLDIIENVRIDTNTNKKKREAWSSVADLFNKVSKNKRSIDQIQSQWRKTKSITKSNNSLYLREMKQTGGGPPPARLNSFDEDLVSRLPKHFEQDYNIYDSNSSVIKSPKSSTGNNGNPIIQILNSDDYQPEDIGVTDAEETPKQKVNKRKVKGILDENSKRIKLIDVSIQQKELEMDYARIEFEKKKSNWEEKQKLLGLQIIQTEEDNNLKKFQNEMLVQQMLHMKEKHGLKMDKLKLEIQNLKKSGYFT